MKNTNQHGWWFFHCWNLSSNKCFVLFCFFLKRKKLCLIWKQLCFREVVSITAISIWFCVFTNSGQTPKRLTFFSAVTFSTVWLCCEAEKNSHPNNQPGGTVKHKEARLDQQQVSRQEECHLCPFSIGNNIFLSSRAFDALCSTCNSWVHARHKGTHQSSGKTHRLLIHDRCRNRINRY